MSIRYSYDDFTTKGHGVIEGYYYPNSGPKKGKRTSKKKAEETKEKIDLQTNYNHLMAIHRQAKAERNYSTPPKKIVVLPKKKK